MLLPLPCFKFRDLLLGGLLEPILEISVVLISRQQLEALLLRGKGEIVLTGGQISIAQAVLRVGGRRIRFGVQLE